MYLAASSDPAIAPAGDFCLKSDYELRYEMLILMCYKNNKMKRIFMCYALL
jgi:hypothetical protein